MKTRPPLFFDVDKAELTDRLRAHVERLAGEIGPRHEGLPESIEATVAHLERALSAGGETVERETFASIDAREATNLIIERRGDTRPEQVVILGAHYDTVPETPGADDNASAVAALVEIVRLLRGVSHRRTLRLIAFANEEPPHFNMGTMGSAHHARRCRARGERVAGMISLEMIGYFRDEPGSQMYPAPIAPFARRAYGDRGDFLGIVGNMRSMGMLRPLRRGFRRATRLPVYALSLPQAVREIRLSDHGPFWDEGFRAVMATDTSFFRNPHYHAPSDTPETLDYARLAEATLGMAGAVLRFARGGKR